MIIKNRRKMRRNILSFFKALNDARVTFRIRRHSYEVDTGKWLRETLQERKEVEKEKEVNTAELWRLGIPMPYDEYEVIDTKLPILDRTEKE